MQISCHIMANYMHMYNTGFSIDSLHILSTTKYYNHGGRGAPHHVHRSHIFKHLQCNFLRQEMEVKSGKLQHKLVKVSNCTRWSKHHNANRTYGYPVLYWHFDLFDLTGFILGSRSKLNTGPLAVLKVVIFTRHIDRGVMESVEVGKTSQKNTYYPV